MKRYLSSFVKLNADNPKYQTGQRNDGHDSNDVDGCSGGLVFLSWKIPVSSTVTTGIAILLEIVVDSPG